MSLLDNLIETGLTRHEAQLYLLLNADGVMSGYEAAKQTGVSRSNTYAALAGLVSKGGAVQIDGEVTRYAAVPASEFCMNKRRRLEQILREIQEEMPARREVIEPFLTIRGQTHILDKMKNLISQAEQRIYLALAPDELHMVLPEVRQLCKMGRKVVIITERPFDLPGATVYHTSRKPGQIRLIVDSATVLTGEISDNSPSGSSCLFSRHQALVSLFKESMMNEISLITVAANQQPVHGDQNGKAGQS